MVIMAQASAEADGREILSGIIRPS
jgi:hypothetical protein